MNMLKWSFVSPELKLTLCVTKSVLSTSKSGGKLKSQSKGKQKVRAGILKTSVGTGLGTNTCWLEKEPKERKQRKQREACFLCVNLQNFQPGQKENTNSYFDWRLLSNSLWSCSLQSWILLFGSNMGQTKKKSFRTCGLTSSSEVEASPASLLACNFKCIQRSSVCETWLCTLAVRRETCQAQWRDGVLFDLSPHQPFLSRRTFMRGDVLKGQLKELFLKIISCLKISGAFITACFKSSF